MTTLHQSQPVVVPAGSGPFVELGDHRANINLSSQQTEGQFALAEMQADFQAHVPPHVHTREDETFYILQGLFRFEIGEQVIIAGPGDTVWAPRDIAHSWRCVSPHGGRALVLLTPGENFERFGIAMAQTGVTPSVAMASEVLRPDYMALTAEYGIHMLPMD